MNLLNLQALVHQIFLVDESQALEIIICLEDFVPIDFLKVKFLDPILAIRMMPNNRLQPARVNAIDLTDDPDVLVLIFVFWDHHVRG